MIARLEQLEQLLSQLERWVGSLEGRVAALEQRQWQLGSNNQMFPPTQVDWFLLTSTPGCSAAATSGGVWTPGSGTADRVRWNGSTWDTLDSGVTVYTGNEKAIDSGSYVRCATTADGAWWVDVPDQCAHLS